MKIDRHVIKAEIAALAIGIIIVALIGGEMQLLFVMFILMIISIIQLKLINDRACYLALGTKVVTMCLMIRDLIDGQFRFGIIVICLVIILALVTSKKFTSNYKIPIKSDLQKNQDYHCTKSIMATIVEVENIVDEVTGQPKSGIVCEAIDPNGKVWRFELKYIIGGFKVSEHDTIQVMVEPDNWEQYQIPVGEIVE